VAADVILTTDIEMNCKKLDDCRHTASIALIVVANALALLMLPIVAANLSRKTPIQWTTIDGVSGLILGLLLTEDTTYTPAYSNSGWRSLRVGMTDKEVHQVLGPPHQRWTVDLDRDGFEESFGERWSFSPGGAHYRVRAVTFTNNRLVRIYSEF
jgi:hypothetical protein